MSVHQRDVPALQCIIFEDLTVFIPIPMAKKTWILFPFISFLNIINPIQALIILHPPIILVIQTKKGLILVFPL